MDYYYLKIMHRLIAVNMSRQEKLDANAEGIQQIELVTQLKKIR